MQQRDRGGEAVFLFIIRRPIGLQLQWDSYFPTEWNGEPEFYFALHQIACTVRSISNAISSLATVREFRTKWGS